MPMIPLLQLNIPKVIYYNKMQILILFPTFNVDSFINNARALI